MTIFGWDASDFDWNRGPMDLAAARRDGIDFFTHKATEGTSTRHKHYGEALHRARDAGIPFLGAYGIPRSSGTVSAQVDYFLAYVDAQTPWWRTWPGWFFQCDLEHWEYDKVPASRGVEWCRLIRQRTGRQVLLYAPRWAYGDGISGSDPLWQSSYGSNAVGHYRALYPGDNSSRWARYSGRTPVVLQYGSRARIGTQNTCDANAFRGSVDDFARLIGARSTIQEEDELDAGEKGLLANAERMVTAFATGQDPIPIPAPWGPEGQQVTELPNPLVRLERKVDALAAIVRRGGDSGGQPLPPATQEQVNVAVKAALQDPGVLAILGEAMFTAAQRAERE